MAKRDSSVCRKIRHGTAEYRETVVLRDAVLRHPLGLEFTTEELAAERDSYHLVCQEGGMLVGCLVLAPLSPRRLRMRQLAVHPDHRGRGVGRTLVSYSEAFATARRFREMILHARETALGFYLKLGYQQVGKPFVEVTLPHVAMRKDLHPTSSDEI